MTATGSLASSSLQAVFHGMAQCPQFHRNRFTHCSREVRTVHATCPVALPVTLLGTTPEPFLRSFCGMPYLVELEGGARTPHRLPTNRATACVAASGCCMNAWDLLSVAPRPVGPPVLQFFRDLGKTAADKLDIDSEYRGECTQQHSMLVHDCSHRPAEPTT